MRARRSEPSLVLYTLEEKLGSDGAQESRGTSDTMESVPATSTTESYEYKCTLCSKAFALKKASKSHTTSAHNSSQPEQHVSCWDLNRAVTQKHP